MDRAPWDTQPDPPESSLESGEPQLVDTSDHDSVTPEDTSVHLATDDAVTQDTPKNKTLKRKPKSPKPPKQPKPKRPKKKSRGSKNEEQTASDTLEEDSPKESVSFVAALKNAAKEKLNNFKTKTSKLGKNTKTKENKTEKVKPPKRKTALFVLDGHTIIKYRFKSGTVSSSETKTYENLEAAAASIPKKADVLWASGNVGFVKSDKTVAFIASNALRYQDAQTAEVQAAGKALFIRAGHMLMYLKDPVALRLAKRKCSLRLSAVSFDPHKSGYWLRVGCNLAEISVIVSGQIEDHVEWPHLGTISARQRIITSGNPPETIAQIVREISTAISSSHSDWLARDHASDNVYIHGPGIKWGGLENSIRDSTSCLVLPASHSLKVFETPNANIDEDHLVMVGQAMGLSPMLMSSQIRRSQKLRSQLFSLLPYGIVVTCVAAILGWSWWQGNTVNSRVSAAETRIEEAQARANSGVHALANRAAEVQEIADTLNAPDPYPWLALSDYLIDSRSRAAGEPVSSIEMVRCETVDISYDVEGWFAGIEEADQQIRATAVEIYGEEGAEVQPASEGTAFDFTGVGGSTVSYSFVPSEAICGAIQTGGAE